MEGIKFTVLSPALGGIEGQIDYKTLRTLRETLYSSVLLCGPSPEDGSVTSVVKMFSSYFDPHTSYYFLDHWVAAPFLGRKRDEKVLELMNARHGS